MFAARINWCGRRFLLNHDMCVGAPDPKRADTRPPCAVPFAQLPIDEEGTGSEVQRRVGLTKMQGRRDLTMLDGQHGLDQARYSGSGVEVADVGFHRSERAVEDDCAQAALQGRRPAGLCRVENRLPLARNAVERDAASLAKSLSQNKCINVSP